MKQISRISALLLIAAFGLYGCVSGNIGPERDINDPTSSLVFVYIDMDDAPTDISWASLKQVAPIGDEGFWYLEIEDGVMAQPYLPTGAFQLASFGGSGFLAGEHQYDFPEYGGNATSVSIKQPGIYFVGAYRYEEVDTGFFEAGKFNMTAIQSPTELELLKRVQKMDWVKGTQWEARIAARIRELSR